MAKSFNKMLTFCVKKEIQQEHVTRAVSVLKMGGVVALPTDTVYGLASLVPYSRKLYDIKHRSDIKPLALCVSSIPDLFKWCKVTVSEWMLRDLLPGPVTLVFQRSESLPDNFNPETDLVGIRIPDSKFVRELCSECDQPLALTSANVSQARSPLSINEFRPLWPLIDLIINGGEISDNETNRAGSTVIDLSLPGKFRVIRQGCAFDSTQEILTSNKYGLVEASESH